MKQDLMMEKFDTLNNVNLSTISGGNICILHPHIAFLKPGQLKPGQYDIPKNPYPLV